MAKKLTNDFSLNDKIYEGNIIHAWHVSQSVDAFTGKEEYDIIISGSLEVIGNVYFKLNNPYTSSNNFKYLGVDMANKKVGYYDPSINLKPLKFDPFFQTVWNPGPGGFDSNTSFGKDNFVSNVSGLNNTAIGNANLFSNVGGFNNTAIGSQNLMNGSHQYYNIGVGNQVLTFNNGSNNIGVGVQVLYNNLAGQDNIGFGNKTLYFNQGSYNTSIGSYSLHQNQGNYNTALGFKAGYNAVLGNNSIYIGSYSGRTYGNNILEIHSYQSENSNELPLILGKFDDRWLRIHGQLQLNRTYNPEPSSLSNTPYQIYLTSAGESFTSQRGFTMTEADNRFQPLGDYVLTPYLLGNYYDRTEVDDKFFNNSSESLTNILEPTLTGNILTIKYVGEDGIIQYKPIDLTPITTVDVRIVNATYDPATNIITITESDGTVYKINLSEFSIITTTNSDGTLSLTQEGIEKIRISKVGISGNFGDLLNKPTTLGGYGITDALDGSPTPQTKLGPLEVQKISITGGLPIQFIKADGSLDSNNYALSSSLNGVAYESWVTNNFISQFHPTYNVSQNDINNWRGYIGYSDTRIITPNQLPPQKLQFGFTSWNNQNTGGFYADFIHFGGHSDNSGGSPNLLMFNKNGFGIRQYQGLFQSSNPYSTYVDYWNTGNFTQTNIDQWNTAYGWGNHATFNYATQTWVGQNYIPQTHPVYNITQNNINSWNEAYSNQTTFEKIANKQNSLAIDGTGTKYPTVDAVNTGLDLRVPYTGATQSVNLNKQKITSVGTINHDAAYREVAGVGRFRDIINLDGYPILKQQTHVWNGSAFVDASITSLGEEAGRNAMDTYSIHLGGYAGWYSKGTSNVNIGRAAGQFHEGQTGVNIGIGAGLYNKANYVVNIAESAGRYNIAESIVNIGRAAGYGAKGDRIVNLGQSAGSNNNGYNNFHAGTQAGEFSIGSFVSSIGYATNQLGIGNYRSYLGGGSGQFATGNYHTVIGQTSYSQFKPNTNAAKTFNGTDINLTDNTITINNHGFGGAGATVLCKFTEGTSSVPGLANVCYLQFYVVDANTLRYAETYSQNGYIRQGGYYKPSGQGTGTGHTLTPSINLNNIVIIGDNLEPTKNNQTLLGGGECLLPQSTVATIDADTTNKTLITKEWFTAKAVSQSSINTQLSGYATLAGTQTFTGTNTFTQNIIVPTATLGSHAVNLNQLSDYVKTSNTIKVTITGITQDVTHNFNTYDIVCEAYDTLTLYNLPIKYKRKNLNTVTIEFDNPVPNSIRLMITKK